MNFIRTSKSWKYCKNCQFHQIQVLDELFYFSFFNIISIHLHNFNNFHSLTRFFIHSHFLSKKIKTNQKYNSRQKIFSLFSKHITQVFSKKHQTITQTKNYKKTSTMTGVRFRLQSLPLFNCKLHIFPMSHSTTNNNHIDYDEDSSKLLIYLPNIKFYKLIEFKKDKIHEINYFVSI